MSVVRITKQLFAKRHIKEVVLLTKLLCVNHTFELRSVNVY